MHIKNNLEASWFCRRFMKVYGEFTRFAERVLLRPLKYVELWPFELFFDGLGLLFYTLWGLG